MQFLVINKDRVMNEIIKTAFPIPKLSFSCNIHFVCNLAY